jgi:hypothetical protein
MRRSGFCGAPAFKRLKGTALLGRAQSAGTTGLSRPISRFLPRHGSQSNDNADQRRGEQERTRRRDESIRCFGGTTKCGVLWQAILTVFLKLS